MTDAADIVGKIREALKAADHICRVDNWPLNRLKVQEAIALLPQLSAMLAKEPVSLEKCAYSLLKNQYGRYYFMNEIERAAYLAIGNRKERRRRKALGL